MTTAEKIAVMQAYEDGKQIQTRTNLFKNNLFKSDWFDMDIEPSWDWALNDYRIKPEVKKPTYRPYKDTYEMIADYKERFNIDVPCYAKPLIWVKTHESFEHLIYAYCLNRVFVCNVWKSLEVLHEKFVYLDGSPVGKLVEA